MNVFRRELRAYRKSVLVWLAGVVLLLVASMAKFATLTAVGGDAKRLIDQFPPAIRSLFGMNGLDITTVEGYFGVLFLYVAVLVSIHAGLLGVDVIAKEEQEKTAEFLYVKPRSRVRILTAKLLAAITMIVIVNGVILTVSCALAAQYVPLNDVWRELILFNIAYFVLQLLFLAVGMAMAASALARRAGRLLAGIVLGAYFMYVAASIQPSLTGVGALSPFVSLDARSIITEGALNRWWVAGYCLFAVGCIGLAYHSYRQRDLHS